MVEAVFLHETAQKELLATLSVVTFITKLDKDML